MSSLTLFSSKKCSVAVGDLYINDLPVTVNEDVLYDALKTLQAIRGVLYVKNNIYLTSLSCFSNVSMLYGAQFVNNPNLVDARMPKLTSLQGPVVVDGCDRLCPARYISVGSLRDDSRCTDLVRLAFFNFEGPGADASAVPLAVGVLGNALKYFSNNTVWIRMCM
jgi:hypothetical protein